MKQLLSSHKTEIVNTENTLSKTAKIFLVIVCLNGVANSLSSIFVNVYLYKLSQNLYDVALFNLVSYLIWAPVFILAGWLSKKTDRKLGLIAGGCFQLLFYFVLLMLADSASENIVMLGLIFGIGSGFYWLSVNTISVDVTNQSNRDLFNGVNGMFNSFSQMIGPAAAGWIITLQHGFNGYQIIFTCTFILFLLSVGLTFLLPKQLGKETFNWKALWEINKNSEWGQLAFVFSCLAFRDGVLSFAIWIWVYMITGSEGSLGNYVFLTTTISMVTYYFIGRFVREKNNWLYIITGTIGISLAILVLVLDVSYTTLLIYGIASGLFIPLFEVPFNTLSLNTISKFDLSGKLRIEMVISREMALSAGRILSVGGITYVYTMAPHQSLWVASYMLFVIIIGLLSLFFLKSYRAAIKSAG